MRRRPTLTVRVTASNPSSPAQTKNTGIRRPPSIRRHCMAISPCGESKSSARSAHGAPYCPPVLLDNGPVGRELLLDEKDQFRELVVAEIVEDRAAGAGSQVLLQPLPVVM